MRILVVHNRYRSGQPSGENRVVEQEVSLLRGAGNDVVLYERRSDDISGFSIIGKAAVPARVVWSPADRRRLGGVLAHRRPDVVHVHNTFPLISPSILSVCREAGVPVVATLHNFRLACANGLLFRSGAPCEDCVGRNPWPGVVHGCYRGSRLATIPVAATISDGWWLSGTGPLARRSNDPWLGIPRCWWQDSCPTTSPCGCCFGPRP